ncbi:efflux transporter, outer membrane factor lipoprotein, NodT family [Bordetella pertussis H934]|nr:efflux transporter, outer membrane factor lipoprotein, NodT family [Bordetella pertussis H934]
MTHPVPTTFARTAGALLAALALAGCAVGPQYQAPTPAPVKLASPEQALFSADRLQREWWRQLQDARLDALIGLALARNLDIGLALARNLDIRQAQARLREARAALDEKELDRWPTVTAAGGYTRSLSQINPGPDQRNLAQSYRAGFDATWEIDLFGRLQRRAEAAAARDQAAAADLAQTRLVVVAELARNYFEMRGAEQRLAVARANLPTQQETLRVTAALVETGRGYAGDLASARAELAGTRALLAPLETQRRLAQYHIAVLAAMRPAELGELRQEQPLAPLAAQLPIGDVAMLLQRRPDVRAAERLLAATNADVGAITAELYPRIDLGGFLGFIALRGGDLGQASSKAFALAPTISWPALHLGSVQAQLRAGQARHDAARARYEQVALQAIEEVEGALTRYGQNQQRLRDLLDSATQSQRAADLAQTRYREGAAPYLTVLDAQRTLLRAQDAVAQSESESYTSLVALYKALGGGWNTDAAAPARSARTAALPASP